MIRRVCILGACLTLLPAISQAAIMIMVEGVTGPNKPAPYTGWFVGDSFAWSGERSNPAKPFELKVHLEQSGTGFASLAQAEFAGAIVKRIVPVRAIHHRKLRGRSEERRDQIAQG